MNRIARITILCAALLPSSAALSAERTVTLAVDKMTCASCPYIVKQALTRLAGVKQAGVSFEEKRATVTFDDAVTSVAG
ncbi:MAG: cation transporter, partial [Steroidobacteraceae bacterium]